LFELYETILVINNKNQEKNLPVHHPFHPQVVGGSDAGERISG